MIKTIKVPPKFKEEVDFAGGKVSSSNKPPLHLIPTIALTRTAEIFKLGKLIKKEKAWNATSHNQDCLHDRDFILERISHVINHAMKLRDKVLKGEMDVGEDDAASITFGGMFLICATDARGFEKDERLMKIEEEDVKL